MTQEISQSERIEILLILALAFERNFGKTVERNSLATVKNSLVALSGGDLEILQTRAR